MVPCIDYLDWASSNQTHHQNEIHLATAPPAAPIKCRKSLNQCLRVICVCGPIFHGIVLQPQTVVVVVVDYLYCFWALVAFAVPASLQSRGRQSAPFAYIKIDFRFRGWSLMNNTNSFYCFPNCCARSDGDGCCTSTKIRQECLFILFKVFLSFVVLCGLRPVSIPNSMCRSRGKKVHGSKFTEGRLLSSAINRLGLVSSLRGHCRLAGGAEGRNHRLMYLQTVCFSDRLEKVHQPT